jgi:hypothetical protein
MVAITADLKTKDLALGMAIALHGFHEVRGPQALSDTMKIIRGGVVMVNQESDKDSCPEEHPNEGFSFHQSQVTELGSPPTLTFPSRSSAPIDS